MLDPEAIVARQLAAAEPTRVRFDDGSVTTLVPARFVPQLAEAEARLSLDGTWRVIRWPFPAEEEELLSPRGETRGWERVEQPGKVFYADPERDPAAIADWDRVRLKHLDPADGAILRRRAELPAAWKGRRVYLRFDAIYPAARIYLDGTLLGEHRAGLIPVEFDVTDLAQPGRVATVAVRLYRRHPIVEMDMPRHALEFAGLAQGACFHAAGPCLLLDHHLVASLQGPATRASLAGEIVVRNTAAEPRQGAVVVQVTDPRTGRQASAGGPVELQAGQTHAVQVRLDLQDPQPWSDETPNLYDVWIQLQAEGQAPQNVRYRTGLARLDLEGGRPRWNGRPVKFRGVNFLSFHPETGLHLPKEWLRRSLQMMKHANINAIRTHYTAPPDLADLCDELGFYLIQEVTVDWSSHLLASPACLGPVLQRVEATVRRDRHHVSLCFFGLGNENLPSEEASEDAFFANLRAMDGLAKRLAPDKRTLVPPPGPTKTMPGLLETRVGDVADIHYSFRPVRDLHQAGRLAEPRSWQGPWETLSREDLERRGWSGVWFSSEYCAINYLPDLLAAPYLSILADRMEDPLGGKGTAQVFLDRLREEWSLMRDDPSCLGGALWVWMAAGAGRPWGWTLWAEDADWGLVTHDLLPKPSFWALRALYSPVLFPERVAWRPGQTELVLAVRNLYTDTDLAQCTLRTMLGGAMPGAGTLRSWRDVPMACPPGQTAALRVPLWNPKTLEALAAGSPAVCRCVVLDPTGYRPITADVLIVPEGAEGSAGGPAPASPVA